MFKIGDIVEYYSHMAEQHYYGVVAKIANNIYCKIEWFGDCPPFSEEIHYRNLRMVKHV